MSEMITARRTAQVKEERYDLFSGLLDATELEDEGARLNNDELLGTPRRDLYARHFMTQLSLVRQHIHLSSRRARGWI